jgi:hypothetical protein
VKSKFRLIFVILAVVLTGCPFFAPAAGPLVPVDMAKPPAGVARVDLFLLIGQSNMKGRGELPAQQTPNPRLVMMHLKNDLWYLALHPVHTIMDPATGKGADNAGTGPALAFAEALAANDPQVLVGLIPCAVGGSKLDAWIKGGKLYEEAVRRARLALGMNTSVPVTLKAALWLQGEADANPQSLPSYQARLAQMIGDLRADLALPDLPFIAATIGEFGDTASNPRLASAALINADLMALSKIYPHFACIDARDLKGNIGDNVHYNAASAKRIGERMAACYQEIRQSLP